MAAPSSNSRKSRRRWLWIPGLVVLLAAAVLLLPRAIDPEPYRDRIAQLLAGALGGEVVLGELSWGLGNGAWLQAESLSLQHPTLLPIELDAGPVYLRLALAPILRKQLVFEQISVADATLQFRLEDPSAVAPTSTAPSSTDSPLYIGIESLLISNGQLLIQDHRSIASRLPGDIHLGAVALELRDILPEREVRFKLGCTLLSPDREDWGQLQGTGQFQGLGEGFAIEQPRLKLQAGVSDLAVLAQRLILAQEFVDGKLEGTLSAKLAYEGDLGEQGSATAAIDLGELNYRDPALWPTPLQVPGSVLDMQLQLSPKHLRVEEIALTWDALSIKGSADINNWATLSNSLLQGTVPLQQLIPIVPWPSLGEDAPIIRDLLEGGGRIDIDQVALPDIAFADLGKKASELLQGTSAGLRFSELSMAPALLLPRIEHIGGELHLRDGTLHGSGISARIGPLSLPQISLQASQLLEQPRLDISAKGPMVLQAGPGAKVDALLQEHGLKSLSGEAQMDVEVHYDQAHADRWDAKGSVQLQSLQLHTQKTDASVDMQGKILLRRGKQLDIALQNLTGRINTAPFRVDGELLDLDSDKLLVNLDVAARELELAPLAELIPAMADSQLQGRLNADLSVFFPYDRPLSTVLKGRLSTRNLGLQLADGDWQLAGINSELSLAANRVNIEGLSGELNEQALTLNGHLSPLPHISGELHLSSASLNLDRVLAASDVDAPASPSASEGASEPAQLPPMLGDAVLQLSAKIDRGQFRDVSFQDADLALDFSAGRVRSHDFSVQFDRGIIHSSGSADLGDLQHLPFDIKYQVDSIRLENIWPLLKLEPPAITGSISSHGRLTGRVGPDDELLRSLRGTQCISATAGKIPDVGYVGKGLFTALSVINVEGLLNGQVGADLAKEGVPYDSFELDSTLTEEGMRVELFKLQTPALSAEGAGLIELEQETVSMDVAIAVLGTLDKVLGMVPLVGSAAATVTKAYLEVRGPLAEPQVNVVQARGMLKALGKEAQPPGSRIGRGFQFLKDSLTGKEAE